LGGTGKKETCQVRALLFYLPSAAFLIVFVRGPSSVRSFHSRTLPPQVRGREGVAVNALNLARQQQWSATVFVPGIRVSTWTPAFSLEIHRLGISHMHKPAVFTGNGGGNEHERAKG
jgi:hypothetical protein